jgi:dCMP deaminase
MRPHWDDVWIAVAKVVSTRSLCSRAQVGAVIVNVENRVIATGYNGPPHNFDHRERQCNEWCLRAQGNVIEASYANCPSLHAEANALMAADRSTWAGGKIYVTGHVCADCAKLIGNSGLSMVIVQDDGVDREYRGYEETYRGLRALGIGVEVLPPIIPPPLKDVPTVTFVDTGVVIQSVSGWVGVVAPEYYESAGRVGGISTDWGITHE